MLSEVFIYQAIYFVASLLAISLIVCRAIAIHVMTVNAKDEAGFLWYSELAIFKLGFLPTKLDNSLTYLALAGAIVFLLSSSRIMWLHRREFIRHKLPSRSQQTELCLLAGTNIGFAIFSCVGLIAARARSDHFDEQRVKTNIEAFAIYSGTFDMYTWMCDLEKAIAKNISEKGLATFSRQCNQEKAGMAVFILYLTFAVWGSVCTISDNRRARVEKRKSDFAKVKEDWESDRTLVV